MEKKLYKKYSNQHKHYIVLDLEKMTVQPKFQHHSNYTKYEAIILFVIGFFLIIMIIVGNFLVIWAVIKDKSLKNMQNWFIGRYFLFSFGG